MKMVKSLILGSAAALVAMSGAQAADLPVKAKAVEYVRICSLYGAGFFYIPGTDTCIKLGGYVRVDTTFNGSYLRRAGLVGRPRPGQSLSRLLRCPFPYGADGRYPYRHRIRRCPHLRSGRLPVHHPGQQHHQPGNFTASPNAGTNTSLLNQPGEGYVAVEMVFIQFAGFTFGKSASAYSTPWHGYPGNQNTSFLLGGNDSVTGVNNIQYTAQFGNGVSGTIGLDDPVVFNRTAVANLTVPIGATGAIANTYAGVHAPDVVGNIRVDQAWGLFQISGAAHEVSGSYNVLNTLPAPAGGVGTAGGASTALSEISGHPDTKWGGSVMAALQIKNIPTGAGDDLKVDVTYAKGDTKNVISTAAASPSFAMFGGTSRAGAYQSVGFGATTDAVFLPTANGGDGSLHLTEAFGVRGAFNHNWDPYWSTSLFGSYAAVRYDGTAKANICTAYTTGKTVSLDYSCNPDYNVSQLGLITRWTPVKNLTFSAEVQWFHLDQKLTGAASLTPTAPKPQATYEYKDQDAISFNVRAQRNF